MNKYKCLCFIYPCLQQTSDVSKFNPTLIAVYADQHLGELLFHLPH